MTSHLEDLLIRTLREEVATAQPPPGIVDRAARQHHRRTTRRRTATAAGVTAAVTLATGVTLTGGPRTGIDPPATASDVAVTSSASRPAAATPQERLVAALAATQRSSFTITLANRAQWIGSTRRANVIANYTGTYDAARRLGSGVNPITGGSVEVRLIGDTCYQRYSTQTRWTGIAGSLTECLALDGMRHWSPATIRTPGPGGLVPTIDGLGTVRFTGISGTGGGAVDNYEFGYRIPADESTSAHELTGTVRVSRDTGLLARVAYRTTVAGRFPDVADGDPLTFDTVITYSDFGIAVDVQAPPAELVDRARAKPAM